MSKSRKHLMNQNTHPIPTEDQHVVRVLELRGNNQVFAEFANEEQILCLMPNKFKRKIWISKGHYIVIKQAEVNSTTKGFQIKGIIIHVLQKDDVQYLKELNIFPFKDETTKTDEEEEIEEEEEYDSDEEVEYEGNPNRISYSYSSDEDSSEDEN
eukprot:gene7205-11521_t